MPDTRPELSADYERLLRLLRDRADSYWRDAVAFREDGDLHASVAYKMIAEELRRCAQEVSQ